MYVDSSVLTKAAEIGNELDSLVSTESKPAFIVVRKASADQVAAHNPQPNRLGVKDSRASELVGLVSARSRVSKSQPSLCYVRDVRASVSSVTAGRHHLIFGRRGAGKSALLVEAMRRIEQNGDLTCWVNIQTYRNEPADRVFLYVLEETLSSILGRVQNLPRLSSRRDRVGRGAQGVSELIWSGGIPVASTAAPVRVWMAW